MKDLINEFFSQYATVILYSILTAIAGVVAAFFKKKYEEVANTKIKRDIAKDVVTFVEQLYKDLDGPAKKQKAIEAIAEMLTQKGIPVSALEIEVLIEAAVGEFNEVWNKEDEYEITYTPDIDPSEAVVACDDIVEIDGGEIQ